MSWYQSTYVGIQDKDEKIYPWGMYDAHGNLHPIYVRSRSFITDIGDYFINITEKNLSEELIKEFAYECGKDPDEDTDSPFFVNPGISQYFGYLPVDEIPTGSYIKTGYCLLTDISQYLQRNEYFEGFYDVLSPEEYSFKLENELKFGEPKSTSNEEITIHSCRDYAYFCWEDTECKEYDAYLMRQAVGCLEDNGLVEKGYRYVIIKTEG